MDREMDSLATIIVAAAVIAEEWRQANRGRPREDYRLSVVQRRTVIRRVIPNARPGRSEEPADMGQAPGQAEDPSEQRFFLTQEEARTVHVLTVRPFPVSGGTSATVGDEVMELTDLRHNMVSYEARYPAAVEVRNILGDEIWDGLEDYRCGVAYLAFSTLRQQGTDSIDFPVGLRAILDQYIPHMETYISARWGEDDRELFQCIHDTLEDFIEEERDEGIEVQDGWPVQFIKKLLRRQPIFWLAYNLNFPVEGRMSWEQVLVWAMQWLMRTNMEAPAWPIQLRGLDVWNPDTTAIWNGAMIELFADIRRRFRLTHTLDEAV